VLTPIGEDEPGTSPALGPIARVRVVRTPYYSRAGALRRWLGTRRAEPSAASTRPDPGPPPPHLRRLRLLARGLFLFPDDHIGWVAPAVAAAEKEVPKLGCALVLSTSPPETCHLIAKRIARRFALPWVADFRDPWSDSYLRERSALDHCHRWLERRTLRTTRALVAVSSEWARRLRVSLPGVPTFVIPNGHDGSSPPATPSDRAHFRILYTGKLNPSKQALNAFLNGFSLWLRRDPLAAACVDGQFYTYGEHHEAVAREIRSRGLRALQARGPVDHATAIQLQEAAHVLLLFPWQGEPGCIPAKVFEYIASRRSILVVGGGASESALIVKAAFAGSCASSAEDVAATLSAWFATWRSGAPLPQATDAAIAEHDFARRLDDYEILLRELLA